MQLARLHMRLTLPALVAVWVFGMGLAGVSKPPGADDIVYHVSETWLVLALIDWAVADGGRLVPDPPGDHRHEPSAPRRRFSAGVGITHLGLVVGLVLMIWKPGA